MGTVSFISAVGVTISPRYPLQSCNLCSLIRSRSYDMVELSSFLLTCSRRHVSFALYGISKRILYHSIVSRKSNFAGEQDDSFGYEE